MCDVVSLIVKGCEGQKQQFHYNYKTPNSESWLKPHTTQIYFTVRL